MGKKKQAHNPIVSSFFHRPVSNTVNQRPMEWSQLYDLLTSKEHLITLPESTSKAKAQLGDYYTRGPIKEGEPRSDENLKRAHIIIIDIDKPSKQGKSLPSPKKVYQTAKKISKKNGGFPFVVHTTATPGNSRVIILTKKYKPKYTDQITKKIYDKFQKQGCKFAWAGESKVKSQAWFAPQTVDVDNHFAQGNLLGNAYNPITHKEWDDTRTRIKAPKPKKGNLSFERHKKQKGALEAFVKDLEKGTIHQAAKTYIGWLTKTTDWSYSQIIDDVDNRINANYVQTTPDDKKERWHKKEKKSLEGWYVDEHFDRPLRKDKAQEDREDLDELVEEMQEQSVSDIFDAFTVSEEDVQHIKDLKFVVPGLVPQGHIVSICGWPNAGKTAVIFFEWCRIMAMKGKKIAYIDEDSPLNVVKEMESYTRKINNLPTVKENKGHLRYIKADLKTDAGIDTFMEYMYALSFSGKDLSEWVFVFDTLKKFCKLMSKDASAEFFKFLRRFTSRGATVILPGHANKRKEPDGSLLFEGVGDVRNDADELLYLYHIKDPEKKEQVISIYPDKIRALIEPVSYMLNTEDRSDIIMLEDFADIKDKATRDNKGSNREKMIRGAILKAVQKKIITRKSIFAYTKDATGAGRNSILELLDWMASEDNPSATLLKTYDRHNNNAVAYSLKTKIKTKKKKKGKKGK